MARVKDYDKKIEELKQKIETKNEQLKGLKRMLSELEAEAANEKMQDISKFIKEKGLNPADVLNVLNEHFK